MDSEIPMAPAAPRAEPSVQAPDPLKESAARAADSAFQEAPPSARQTNQSERETSPALPLRGASHPKWHCGPSSAAARSRRPRRRATAPPSPGQRPGSRPCTTTTHSTSKPCLITTWQTAAGGPRGARFFGYSARSTSGSRGREVPDSPCQFRLTVFNLFEFNLGDPGRTSHGSHDQHRSCSESERIRAFALRLRRGGPDGARGRGVLGLCTATRYAR